MGRSDAPHERSPASFGLLTEETTLDSNGKAPGG